MQRPTILAVLASVSVSVLAPRSASRLAFGLVSVLVAVPVVAAGGGAFASTSAQAAAGSPAPLVEGGDAAVPGHYIVTVQSDGQTGGRSDGQSGSEPDGQSGAEPREAVLEEIPRGSVTHVYRHVTNGFSARLDRDQLARVRRDPNVVKVREVVRVRALDTQRLPPWGLDRIDQRERPRDLAYGYDHSGDGVTAYVIDTGLAPTHRDFGDRAKSAYDATGGDGVDCNGHGTHVAGTLGGSTYGVVKDVALRGVRVLDCQGLGTDADTVAGMDWVAENAEKPAVANMSLGGGASGAIDDAAANLSQSGVYLVTAAGNEGTDACRGSPSGAADVMTVAASDYFDRATSFTNHGSCVEMFAPGEGIRSAWPNGGLNILSGTSMAAPHVAGVAALYKEASGDAASSTVDAWLTENATRGQVSDAPSGTPNLLLNTGGL